MTMGEFFLLPFLIADFPVWRKPGLEEGWKEMPRCSEPIAMSLERFHDAQADADSGYETALAEMRSGRKHKHWIWYVFPQLAGLGHSGAARHYAIQDLAEACEYLRDPVLRARYEEITAAVAEKLKAGVPVERLMGGSIDALKLASSLTLFSAAASRLADAASSALARRCDAILRITTPQGYPACPFTVRQLSSADD